MVESARGADRDRLWNCVLRVWVIAMGLVWLVGPFVVAGTYRWPALWLYMATIVSGALVQRVYVSRRNPGVLERRRRAGPGTKGWDVAWLMVFAPLTALAPIVAALGVRFGWPTLPLPFALLGVLANTVAGIVWAYAMASNAHFEPTVRIQRDIGHVVVDGGPYRLVRHPGYAAFVLGAFGAPMMLLSWPAVATGPILAAWFVVRAVLEDATLRDELPGYADYARRVPFRLLPGIW